eukprot:2403857-Pyramimonas_sp.AAC.1
MERGTTVLVVVGSQLQCAVCSRMGGPSQDAASAAPWDRLRPERKELAKVRQSMRADPPLTPTHATAITEATNGCSSNGVPPSMASTYASKGYVR